MGNITIVLNISENKSRMKVNAIKPDVVDLSIAIAQLELLKINLLNKTARMTKINRINY